MRCREARRKIARLLRDGLGRQVDPRLRDHLKNCPDCARQAQADDMLAGLMAASAVDDTGGITPLDIQKTRITARAAEAKPAKTRRRPKLGYAIMVAAVVLMVFTLVPFRYDHVIGYEIAFDGVDKGLADDIHQICDILFSLGLEDADVDILGCDNTCSLMIVDLKTEEEAQRVISAFSRIHTDDLTSSIIPVRASTSGSLLDRANESILGRPAEFN